MTDISNALVQKYIEAFNGEIGGALREVTDAILEAAPNAETKINYGVLAFALVPGGKRETQIMVGGYDKHIGFYPHPTAVTHFVNEIKGKYKYAKGSVQFKTNEDIPKELIMKMVRYRGNMLNK